MQERYGQAESPYADIVHRPNPDSRCERAATEPQVPRCALRGQEPSREIASCTGGDNHYADR
jgi:hypothetical protein